jgi:hypothetical protein
MREPRDPLSEAPANEREPKDPLTEALDAEAATIAANNELRREAAGRPPVFVTKGPDTRRGNDGFEKGIAERRSTANR